MKITKKNIKNLKGGIPKVINFNRIDLTEMVFHYEKATELVGNYNRVETYKNGKMTGIDLQKEVAQIVM